MPYACVSAEVGGMSMRLVDVLYLLARAGGPDAPRAAAEWAVETGRITADGVDRWTREIQAGRADLRAVESLAPVLLDVGRLVGRLDSPPPASVGTAGEADLEEFDGLFPPATAEEAARRADEANRRVAAASGDAYEALFGREG
jgi:hypothetical protein